MGTYASNFLLNEEKYVGIVDGWNEKLSSSSLKLSELTPFIELYAVFKSGDIIFKNPSVASEVSQRLVDVRIKENKDDTEHTIKIAPICSSNKTQLERDSLQSLDSSYRGQPGINDLSVARGAEASLNVKYDLSITIPNPEIFNELFEYSRLISTNSTFLIIYGWNIPDTFGSSETVKPPNLFSSSPSNPNSTPIIDLKTGGKGYYEAALVNVYKFDFSFDNVGHLTGKVSFLPEIGSFLVGTRTDAISRGALNRLISHSNTLPDDDADITFTVDGEEKTMKFKDAINPFYRGFFELGPDEFEEAVGLLSTFGEAPPPGEIIGEPPNDNDNQNKIARAAYKAAVEAQGEFNIPTDGTPFMGEVVSTVFVPSAGSQTILNLLTTMPNYGTNLMKQIDADFKNQENPNYVFDGLFSPTYVRFVDNERKVGISDTETYTLRSNTSVISVPLMTILAEGQEPEEGQGELLERSVASEFGSDVKARVFIQSQPVYFFLGAVLESISHSVSPSSDQSNNELDVPSVKFVYNDLPFEPNQKYSVPIPQPTKGQFDSDKEALNSQIKDIDNQVSVIDGKLGDDTKYTNAEGEQLEGDELADAKDTDQQEKFELRKARAIAEANLVSLETIADGFINNYRSLEVANVFDLPVDISRVRSVMSNGNAPLHSLIKQIIDLANETNPTIKLATRPYNKNSRYIEVYAANVEVEGVSKDIFNSINLSDFGGDNLSPEAKVQEANRILSRQTVVCEFGTERSLVENFSLNAKVDATAFASFRLPAVVGGRSIDLSDLVKSELEMNNSSLIGDIENLIRKGFVSSKKQLEDLQIITTNPDTGRVENVSRINLTNFLKLASDSENVAGRQVVVRLIDELRAADSTFSNSIIAKQNARLMTGSDANSGSNKPSFFGGVLSNFLRRITLTIHGTVGLSTFNLIYVKGLMRGIEGIYQITSVTESLTPANFSTTLECALVNYKDSSPETNPFAAGQLVSLTQLSETGFEGQPDYNDLITATTTRLQQATDANKINWDG